MSLADGVSIRFRVPGDKKTYVKSGLWERSRSMCYWANRAIANCVYALPTFGHLIGQITASLASAENTASRFYSCGRRVTLTYIYRDAAMNE